MSEAITIRQGRDGNPVATLDTVYIDISGADAWSSAATELDPFATIQNVYYVSVHDDQDVEVARSQQFSTSADGDAEWNGYVFPVDGSFDLVLLRVAQGEEEADQEITTLSVTVDAAPSVAALP